MRRDEDDEIFVVLIYYNENNHFPTLFPKNDYRGYLFKQLRI